MATTVNEGYAYITNGTLSTNSNSITDHTNATVARTVKVAIIKVDDDIVNEIVAINIPRGPGTHPGNTNTWTNSPETIFINLLTIKRVITITGHLEEESSDDGGSKAGALEKRDDLLRLMNYGSSSKLGNPVKLIWGKYNATNARNTRHTSVDSDTGNYVNNGVQGAIQQIKITEVSGVVGEDIGDSDFDTAGTDFPTGARKFDIMLKFMEGEHKF